RSTATGNEVVGAAADLDARTAGAAGHRMRRGDGDRDVAGAVRAFALCEDGGAALARGEHAAGHPDVDGAAGALPARGAREDVVDHAAAAQALREDADGRCARDLDVAALQEADVAAVAAVARPSRNVRHGVAAAREHRAAPAADRLQEHAVSHETGGPDVALVHEP